MSNTPRTDAVKIACGFQAVPEPMLQHAYKLERENAALREQKESLIRQRNDASKLYFTAQQVEIPALLRENAALREALVLIANGAESAKGIAKVALGKEAQP